jgi:hypothetical protein
MARIRSVKPELLEDEKTALLPHDTWRLFVSSLLLADDYGNLRASPLLVHGAVFWAHAGVDVARMLRELGDAGLLKFYSVNGQRYAHINGWSKHQKVDHPGKPLCPGPEKGEPEGNGGDGGHGGEQRSTDSRKSREDLAPDRDRDRDLTRTRITGRSEDTSSSGEVAGTPPAPASPALLVFPTVRGKKSGGTEWRYTEAVEAELREYFPNTDVRAAARAALAWVKAKPERRKTGRGMMAFLTGWLGRAQQRGDHRIPTGSNGSTSESRGAPAGAGLALYCDWHKQPLNDGKPSRRPKPTCPSCKHLTARERVGGSDGPTPVGALADELPGWAGGNGVAR